MTGYLEIIAVELMREDKNLNKDSTAEATVDPQGREAKGGPSRGSESTG